MQIRSTPREFLAIRYARLTILFNSYQQAALQPGKLSVTTKSHMRTVTGAANRFILTKEVLEFCGALPIYNTEISLAEIDADNGNAGE